MSVQEKESGGTKRLATEHPSDPPKRTRTAEDPAFFVLFAGEDQIHRILLHNIPTPYQGAVQVPAAGIGAGSSAISFQRFTTFLDQVAAKVGMTNEHFAVDFYRHRKPGVFHGVRQDVAEMFENELDAYAWVLGGGLTAGKSFKVVPTGRASTTILHKRVGPLQ